MARASSSATWSTWHDQNRGKNGVMSDCRIMAKKQRSSYYHTAIKDGARWINELDPIDRYEQDGNLTFRNDLILHGVGEEFSNCDLIYAEPPFPAGQKVFDERNPAVKGTRDYGFLIAALVQVVNQETRPLFLVVNHRLKRHLKEPAGVVNVRLNGHLTEIAYWNYQLDLQEFPVTSTTENLDLTEYLGSKFDCMGDFTCGYGEPVFRFLQGGGKRFVAADYDGRCIAVMRDRMQAGCKPVTG